MNYLGYSLAHNLSQESLPLGERTRRFISQKRDEVMKILNSPTSLAEFFSKNKFTEEDLKKLMNSFNEIDARIYLAEMVFRNSPFPIAIFQESDGEIRLAEANNAYCEMVQKALNVLLDEKQLPRLKQLQEQGNPVARNLAHFRWNIHQADTFQLIKGYSSHEIGECIYSPAEWKRIERYIFEASETGGYRRQIVCTPLHEFPFAWDNTQGVRIGLPLQHYVEHQLFRDQKDIIKKEGLVEFFESQKIDFRPHDFIASKNDSTSTNALIRNISLITKQLTRTNNELRVQLRDLHIFDEILENRQFALAVYDRTPLRRFLYANSYYLQSAAISLARTIRLSAQEKENIIRNIKALLTPLVGEEKTSEIIMNLKSILAISPEVLEKNLEAVRANLSWIPEIVLRHLIYTEEEIEKIHNLNQQVDKTGSYYEPADCTMKSEQTFRWNRQILDGRIDIRYGMPIDNFYETLFASMYARRK